MEAPGVCRDVSAAAAPEGRPPSLSFSVPSCAVPLAVWEGVLEMQSEMAAGLLTASAGTGRRESRTCGVAGAVWGHGDGTEKLVQRVAAWDGAAGVAQGPAQLCTAQGKVLARRPAATEGLARFRWSWLGPHVSFGNGASGLSTGNSRVASAQSKQLTHLLLLPLSRET